MVEHEFQTGKVVQKDRIELKRIKNLDSFTRRSKKRFKTVRAKMEKVELGSMAPSVGRGSHGAISFCQTVIAGNNCMYISK